MRLRPTLQTIRLSSTWLTLAFGGVIGLSAFLLFSVEPLIGRVVLPVFGGTPAVWATVLCFFQAVLLVGYLYGHISVTRLGIRRGAVVHAFVASIAVAALLLAPARVADLRTTSLPEIVDLLAMLLVTIGIPAFLLTATTPLLSAWFASLKTDDRGDAYWLYALSNAGSLLALLAYPFLIEPHLGLTAQRGLWAAAFAVFALLLGACAWWTATGRRPAPTIEPTTATTASIGREEATDAISPALTWSRRGRWFLLAAVPSGLLSAVTTFIATDLVSAPLLWLAPLAIYLVSFIIAFSARGRRIVPFASLLAPAAITLLWVPFGSAGGWPIIPLVLLEFGCLAVVATSLHGRLAEDRPSTTHLTEFYLVISLGGAAASAFVAILAPILFPGIWEYPILLVLGLVALAVSSKTGTPTAAPADGGPRPRFDLSPFLVGAPTRVGPYLVVAAILGAMLVRDPSLGTEAGLRWLLVGGLVLLVGARPAFLAASTALVLALAVLVLQPAAVFRDRSFFGVTEVLRPQGATVTTLMNGTTVHGIQSTDPSLASSPMSYYARSGPFGEVFRRVAAGADGVTGSPRSIAVVGLGAGALTAYREPGWTMTYFEIDPLVAQVASDPSLFTYLSEGGTPPEIVLGDARLSLATIPTGSYDALVLDAFSSDAIPAHLLTVEAMAEYTRVVRPGGLVVVHTSNRYYDLGPAVAAAAGQEGLTTAERLYIPSAAESAAGAWPTRLVVASASTASIDAFEHDGWSPLPVTVEPMTDDFMNVLRFLDLH